MSQHLKHDISELLLRVGLKRAVEMQHVSMRFHSVFEPRPYGSLEVLHFKTQRHDHNMQWNNIHGNATCIVEAENFGEEFNLTVLRSVLVPSNLVKPSNHYWKAL